MRTIFKPILSFAAVASLFASCEEFQPVFTGKYPEPPAYEVVDDSQFENITSIKDLKAMYKAQKPFVINNDIVIKGQVTSSDQSGNMYRSFYIQDATGAIEIKIGKTGLYNDYKPGQWVYIKCEGLTLGGYRGMVNLGYKATDEKYETSYLDVQKLIDHHIFRGRIDEPVKPVEMKPEDMMDASNSIYNEWYGKLVTIKGLVYDNETFTLVYLDPDGDREDYSGNGMFLDESGGTWGITTWAMSDTKFMEYLGPQYPDEGYDKPGHFDACDVAGTTVGEIRKGNYMPDGKNPVLVKSQAGTVSHYFRFGNKRVQIRTSGYSRFADDEIDPRILNGTPIDVTGIFTIYTGKGWSMTATDDKNPQKQFTLLSLDGVKISGN